MRSILFRSATFLSYLLIGVSLAHAFERQGLYFTGAEAVPAPVLGTTVEMRVTGIIARTRVTQIFTNPSQEWVEGIYIFPLPDAAAVDTLRMKIGDRVIRGAVQEKQAARQTYETAKREGKKTTLIEQLRPDVFTTAVANVGPGETVEIAIEMQQVVRYANGKFSLRFPMVVAPRKEDKGRPFSFHADLNPGFPLAKIESPSHAITVEKGKQHRYAADLKKGLAYAERDLVLEWTPAVGRDPRAVYYTEEIGGEKYGLLMVMPPDDPGAVAARLPRETTFIIDTSGSMEGESIEQARQSLLLALDRLQPVDRFNVIEFNSTATAVFPASVPANAASIGQARRYVQGLKANGGTNMLPALQAAFKPGAPAGLVQQVIFATDGQVYDGSDAFWYLRDNLGERRFFTVAIGSAPQIPFLRLVADLGRASLTHIASTSEVAAKMGALFAQLESPMLHRLEVQWSDPNAETWPSRVPDVYLGEPLVVAAKLSASGPVSVKGQRGESAWEDSFPAPAVVKGAGIGKLWARRKIQALEDSATQGADLNEVRRQVTDLGLRHHLVTTWTSLVAVDESPTAPSGAEPVRKVLPVNQIEPEADPDMAVEDVISVVGEAPLLDERRISTGATVSQTNLEKIPAARDPYAVLQTTPGVLTDRVNVGGNESGQQSVYVGRNGSDQQSALPICARVLDTTKARSHRARAEALVKAGKLKKAEAEYIQALVYDPTDEEAWRGLEALGQLAGFAVNRAAMGQCTDEDVEAMGRFIRAVVIVR